MITLVTADLHLGDNPRDQYRLDFFERLPALAQEHGAGRVLILGDVTEIKDGHRAALVNRIVDGTAALAEVAQIYFLKGNHDYVAEDVPFYRFLRHLRKVRWINDPTPLELRGLGWCLFLPHTARPDDWVTYMNDDYDWFFCHQTFAGADLGGDHQARGGFDPGIFRGKKFMAISGDVHTPQKVGPVTYVGAPYTVDFGDSFEPRVLLLEEGKVRSVPVGGPQKRLVTLSGPDPMAALARAPKSVRAGDIIKVRVELPPRSDLSRAQVRAKVAEWAAEAGMHLYAVQVIAPAARPASLTARQQRRTPDADMVRAYVKKMQKGKATLAAGLKIAEEVL